MADAKLHEDVTERLVARRARLQPFCHVDSVNDYLRLQSYFQLARQLYRQSEVYFAQQSWDNAYVFLAKFIKLCSKVVTAHKDYDLPAFKKEREWVRAQAKDGFALFDAILDGMEHEETELLEYERTLELERDVAVSASASRVVHAATPTTTSTVTAAAMLAARPRTLEQRLEALRVRPPVSSDSAVAVATAPHAIAESRTMQPRSEPSAISSSKARSQPAPRRQEAPKPTLSSASINYPLVGKPSWMATTAKPATLPSSADASARRRTPPASRQHSIDAIDRFTSGKIRKLEIPTSLIAQFTALASPNTQQLPYGIETCGILAGALQGSNLVITTLVIPKQHGSSDMCSMTNEEELFDYCFSHDLLTLGWIHTHPRQTCFLSSVDIHTQCGFQSILPEAIAIVVAPTDRDRNVGVFRLIEPHGLQLIQNCRLAGFHEHPSNVQIYSDAVECEWDRHASTHLVDMR